MAKKITDFNRIVKMLQRADIEVKVGVEADGKALLFEVVDNRVAYVVVKFDEEGQLNGFALAKFVEPI